MVEFSVHLLQISLINWVYLVLVVIVWKKENIMEKEMKSEKYLGRGIHNKKFLESLEIGNLRQMLDVINSDHDLDVQIRDNYLNIYFKGGNIAKVSSEKSVVFDKFYFYLDMKNKPTKEIKQNDTIKKKLESQRDFLIRKFKEGDYKGYFEDAKETMNKWLDKKHKPERMEQHQLSIENTFNKSDYTIIDLEYQVSTQSDFVCSYIPHGKVNPKNPRFDIIAINKQGKLCVIEFKKGRGALGNTSGLKEHWLCYQKSIGQNPQPFMNEMKNILVQKQAFNLVDNRVKIEYPIPEFIFAYAYDDKDLPAKQDEIFQKEYNKVEVDIHVIKLEKGTYKLLDL